VDWVLVTRCPALLPFSPRTGAGERRDFRTSRRRNRGSPRSLRKGPGAPASPRRAMPAVRFPNRAGNAVGGSVDVAFDSIARDGVVPGARDREPKATRFEDLTDRPLSLKSGDCRGQPGKTRASCKRTLRGVAVLMQSYYPSSWSHVRVKLICHPRPRGGQKRRHQVICR